MENSKFTIVTAISIVAIILSSIAVVMLLTNVKSEPQTTYSGQTKEFWVFTSDLPEFNETKMGMPHDVFSTSTITVTKGDAVIIHFYNTEDIGADSHTFTIDKPYFINIVLQPGQNKTITFNADTSGIFNYVCTFHQPTMRGQLIVLEPPRTTS